MTRQTSLNYIRCSGTINTIQYDTSTGREISYTNLLDPKMIYMDRDSYTNHLMRVPIVFRKLFQNY